MEKNKIKKITERDLLKMEIAEQLGFGDKLREFGWGGLTARETGKVGGHITIKRKEDNEGK